MAASLVAGRAAVHWSGIGSIGGVVLLAQLPTGYTISRSLIPWISSGSMSGDFGRSIPLCAGDFRTRSWSVTGGRGQTITLARLAQTVSVRGQGGYGALPTPRRQPTRDPAQP